MTGADTGQTAAPPLGRVMTPAGRLARIAAILAGMLLVNFALYAIGRALGGTFTYRQNGADVPVEPVAITFLSVLPLASGLGLVAALSRKWPATIRIARIAGPALALVTIGVMTIPAGFDTTSAVFLAAMHLVVIPATLLALNTLPRGPGRDTRPFPAR